MNKREFFRELKTNLEKAYKKINLKEVDSTLRDFEEYFEEGKSEGKNEDEIVKSFGSPRDIVDEMVRNDIEYGKYREEDFKHYFKKENIHEKINLEDSKKAFIGFSKIFLTILLVFFDIIYFPVVLFTGIGITVGFLATLLSIPSSLKIFHVIGQNSLTIIFPIIFVIGAAILSTLITVVLTMLGIKLNKRYFLKKNIKSKII